MHFLSLSLKSAVIVERFLCSEIGKVVEFISVRHDVAVLFRRHCHLDFFCAAGVAVARTSFLPARADEGPLIFSTPKKTDFVGNRRCRKLQKGATGGCRLRPFCGTLEKSRDDWDEAAAAPYYSRILSSSSRNALSWPKSSAFDYFSPELPSGGFQISLDNDTGRCCD